MKFTILYRHILPFIAKPIKPPSNEAVVKQPVVDVYLDPLESNEHAEDDKNNKKPNLISESEDDKKNSLKVEAEEDLNETHENHNINETSEIHHEKKEEPSQANIDSQVLNKEDDNDGLLDEENKEHDNNKPGNNENLPSEEMEDDDVL